MRFASKHARLCVIIRGEERTLTIGPGGMAIPVISKPYLAAQFESGMLRPHEVQLVDDIFSGRATFETIGSNMIDLGAATPYAESHDILDQNERIVGQTAAFTPSMRYSCFDTDWIKDPLDRVFAEEQLLLGEKGCGNLYVPLGEIKLKPPWPSYDTIKQGAHHKIPSLTRELGLDPASVASYERQNKNRDGVLRGLEDTGTAIAQEIAEDEALTVQI